MAAAQTRARLNQDVRWTRTGEEAAKSGAQVTALLAHELSVDDAVQIALLNNRELQSSFEELGISEADLVQSGRLPNPRFTFRHAGAGPLYDIEETLTFNVLSLLTVPYAHDIEKRRFAQAQSAVVIEVVKLANETRQAYFAAVAARESVRYLTQVKAAAETGAELARRLAGSAQDGEVLVMKRSLLEPFPDVYRHVSCPFAQVAATSAQGSVVAFLAGRMPPAPCRDRRK